MLFLIYLGRLKFVLCRVIKVSASFFVIPLILTYRERSRFKSRCPISLCNLIRFLKYFKW